MVIAAAAVFMGKNADRHAGALNDLFGIARDRCFHFRNAAPIAGAFAESDEIGMKRGIVNLNDRFRVARFGRSTANGRGCIKDNPNRLPKRRFFGENRFGNAGERVVFEPPFAHLRFAELAAVRLRLMALQRFFKGQIKAKCVDMRVTEQRSGAFKRGAIPFGV